jgi:hypothetical protein
MVVLLSTGSLPELGPGKAGPTNKRLFRTSIKQSPGGSIDRNLFEINLIVKKKIY